jgi:phosphoribosyl-ATP pyrophosphohydrolase
MIVPSIDLIRGNAVQLVGGKTFELDAGDPRPLAERFRLAGEVAVVDLDAALRQGSNEGVIRELIRIAPCRVGGGIRSVEQAIVWLDAGATKVVLGTAATPEVLRELPRERVVAALDAVHGEVVVDGWREKTGRGIVDRVAELREFAAGFLVTFVEREGRMQGTDLAAVEAIVKAAGDARVTIAGGVTTCAEIAALDRLGADAQVGMALYKGVMDLGEAIAAPLHTDRGDGLWPTVVVDEHGVALGLCYSSLLSLKAAVTERRGVYWSRSRGEIWRKGETSGATQELLRIDLDCDRDALRFSVRQQGGGFCHTGTRTCWGADAGLPELARRLASRLQSAPPGSYTRRLLDEANLLRSKLAEEARELADAATSAEVIHEAADVIYFALVALTRGGGAWIDVERELDRRGLKVTRRPGDAKPGAPDSARS